MLKVKSATTLKQLQTQLASLEFNPSVSTQVALIEVPFKVIGELVAQAEAGTEKTNRTASSQRVHQFRIQKGKPQKYLSCEGLVAAQNQFPLCQYKDKRTVVSSLVNGYNRATLFNDGFFQSHVAKQPCYISVYQRQTEEEMVILASTFDSKESVTTNEDKFLGALRGAKIDWNFKSELLKGKINTAVELATKRSLSSIKIHNLIGELKALKSTFDAFESTFANVNSKVGFKLDEETYRCSPSEFFRIDTPAEPGKRKPRARDVSKCADFKAALFLLIRLGTLAGKEGTELACATAFAFYTGLYEVQHLSAQGVTPVAFTETQIAQIRALREFSKSAQAGFGTGNGSEIKMRVHKLTQELSNIAFKAMPATTRARLHNTRIEFFPAQYAA